jgi:uncharacterized membrane protein
MTRLAIFRIQATIGSIYVLAGGAKLAAAPLMVDAFDVIGLGQTMRVVVGALEIVGGLCLFVPMASVYAALMLGCMVVAILGATVGHVARLGAERPQLDVPQLTVSKMYHASVQRGGVTHSLGA